MTTTRGLCIALLVAFCMGGGREVFGQRGHEPRYSDRTLLVHFEDRGAAQAARHHGSATLEALGGRIEWTSDLVPGLAVARLPGAEQAELALMLLRQEHGIRHVERDAAILPLATPNDPEWDSQQRYMDRACFRSAWNLGTTSGVVLAVLDSGVNFNLPELKVNLLANTGEPQEPNGLDDDGNGYIDDYWGTEFLPVGDPYSTSPFPFDISGHGTFVCSVLAASGNNQEAMTGGLWTCAFVPVKIMGYSEGPGSSGFISNAIKGIEYAHKRGARIMNCSWYTWLWSDALYKTINAASDTLFVAGAGNFAFDLDHNDCFAVYPAQFDLPNLIVVGASTPDDTIWSLEPPDCTDRELGSCWGEESVDLFAPGAGITVIHPGGAVLHGQEGTSYAAPLVSAAAGLVWTRYPTIGPVGVKQRLMAKVDPIFPGLCVSGGRLNVAEAVGVPCQ